MPLLFSYGTLQEPAVQMATFNRFLEGEKDTLPGHTRTIAVCEGRVHANATPTGAQSAGVSGTVFEVTEAELEAADVYEASEQYVRREVVLQSGRRAWVYTHADS